jgi:hypothetical protein
MGGSLVSVQGRLFYVGGMGAGQAPNDGVFEYDEVSGWSFFQNLTLSSSFKPKLLPYNLA